MANLYDKAGLVNIPVGYQEGFLYNIKPEDNTLGFRFNRDSAATLVNSKGLIEQVGYFGPELVKNGNFSELGSELMPSVGVIENLAGGTITQISGNSYSSTSDGTSSSTLRPKFDFNTTSGKTYKLVITPIGTITGTVNFDFYDGTTYLFQNYDFTTTKEIYFTDNGSVFGAFDGTQTYSISNFTISVKQVDPNNYWTLGTGWSFGNNKATFDGGSDANLSSSSNVVNGKKYKYNFTITDMNTGSLSFRLGSASTNDLRVTSNGYYSGQAVSDGTSILFRAESGFNGSITNISVTEVLGDKPRIDYTDSLTSPSFLLEPQSTNLVEFSEDFSQSSWAKYDVNIESGYDAPDGSNNAYKITKNGSNAHIAGHGGINVNKHKSIWARTVSGTGDVYLLNRTGNILFTLTTKWQRFDVAHSGADFFYAVDFRGSSTTLTEVIIWGAQLEQLPYATSYIPTAGSTVTRAEETCVGAGNVSTFNSTEGVLYAEIAALANQANYRYIALTDGTTNNRVDILYRGDVANRITSRLTVGGAEAARFDITIDNELNYNKFAISWKQNEVKFFINGTQQGSTDTNANVPPANTLNELMFNRGDGNEHFFGKTKGVYVFNEALTDDELQQLTGPEYNSFAALAAAYNYTVI